MEISADFCYSVRMLSLERQQGQIVEKILRNRAGGYVRAVFLVAEFQIVCSLPAGIIRPLFEPVRSYGAKPIPSPFSDFTFFNSQPTRAPSFAI